ncbi:hypothetical protein PG996_000210 [Apiospora saccharicola]|uniref:Uncharacterized protein n=1 Tax=Apiospora saccharicola TaxID=335842 RepID=A0ABR1WD44_9PEZI
MASSNNNTVIAVGVRSEVAHSGGFPGWAEVIMKLVDLGPDDEVEMQDVHSVLETPRGLERTAPLRSEVVIPVQVDFKTHPWSLFRPATS